MSFSDLDLKISYRSDNEKELVEEFYLPVLKESIIYKRAVGFFSSSSLVSISKGISQLIINGGRMQLIVSPRLLKEDIDAIILGYKSREEIIKQSLIDNFYEPTNIVEEERYNYLAHLIENNQLDIKVAIVNGGNINAIYHEKIGIMLDRFGNKVAFTGSLNETDFAYNSNFESIDVFCSWNNVMDNQRVERKEMDFDLLWKNKTNKLSVFDFPEAVKKKILKYRKADIIPELDLYRKEKEQIEKGTPLMPKWFHIRNYQQEAIEAWEKNNFEGLLNMATGTGKTLTALGALTTLYKTKKNESLLAIIVCPYTHLVDQWKKDVVEFNINPVIAYSDPKYKGWNNKIGKLVYRLNLNILNFACIITTNSTYKSGKFQDEINKCNENVLIVIDEAHNAGAEEFEKYLNPKFKYRLALSATPQRYNDEYGTEKIFNYFKKEVYNFSLERAIAEGFLTRYFYYPQIIFLTEHERKRYTELTKKIAKFLDKNGQIKKNKTVELLLIKRARIIAGAENKIKKLKELMKDKVDSNYNLIYCGATYSFDDDRQEKQIDIVTKLLGNELGMRVARFTSEENIEERAEIINSFSNGKTLQSIVAIKCLDEGVNIPAIRNAYILSSSTNPREFIQRRGRVLRKCEGKEYASIYDFITLPRQLNQLISADNNEIKSDLRLIKKELKRVKEFAALAINKYKAQKEIDKILEFYDVFDINEGGNHEV